MLVLRELLQRLLFRFRRARFDEDLDEEMRLHLDLRTADRVAEGVPKRDAEAGVRRQFGNLTRLQETSREAWSWIFLDRLKQDLRYGLRALAAQPAFTVGVLASLTLGIGANTAIFSVINAVMLRSLPVEDPQALVQIKLGTGADDEINTPIWEQIRDRQKAFGGVLAYAPERFNGDDEGLTRHVQGLWVSGDFFRVLGVPAALGRYFTTTDDQWGGGKDGPVAMISEDFWASRFHKDPGIIGRTLRLNRQSFTVVGVTPGWFKGLDVGRSFEVAIPIGCQPVLRTGMQQADEINHWWLRIVGRMPPDGNLKQTQERLDSVTPLILGTTLRPGLSAEEGADYVKSKFYLHPAGLGFSEARMQYRTALLALMSIVGLVLLIACANVANLLLARGTARQRELSVRMAIGASRIRVIRQLMTESLMLAALGASGGLVLAIWGGRALSRLLSTSADPLDLSISLDSRLFAFNGLAALITAVLFGLMPALRSTRIGVSRVLKENERGTLAGSRRLNLAKVLVAGQIAVSMILLAAAFLFVGTLRNLLTVDTGFDRRSVLLMTAELPQSTTVRQRVQIYSEILDRLQRVPGVLSAASSMLTPITPMGWAQPVAPEGFSANSPKETLVFLNRVSAGYFGMMRTQILIGREFNDRDTLQSPRVILINETTARSFFGSASPLGRTIGLDNPGSRGQREAYQIVGVVKDARYNRIDEAPRKIAYLAGGQDAGPGPSLGFSIRYAITPDGLIPSIRSALGSVGSDILFDFRTFEDQVSDSLLRPRLTATLSAIFGGLALALAAVGLFGITTYSVTRRRNEIGLRIALGASQRSVVWLILRDLSLMLGGGIIVGLGASLASGSLVSSLLYGLKPTSPEPLAAGALILLLTTAVAAYLPARRASRFDPIVALRDE